MPDENEPKAEPTQASERPDTSLKGGWDRLKEGWGSFRGSRPWVKIAVGVVVGLIVIGAILGEEEEDGDDPQPVAAEETDQAEPEPAEPRRYRMSFRATRDGDEISASGETNLPDGGTINLIASRVFRNKREDENRAVHVGDATATVENGSFEAAISSIDESDLTIGVPDALGPVAEIDSELAICAEFRTGEEDGEPRQPDADVRSEVGDAGEALQGGRGASEFGELTDSPSTWLEDQTHLEYPVTVLDEIISAQGNAPEVRPLDERFCV